jgi:integrase
MASIPGLKKVGSFWQYSIQVNGQRAHGSTKAMDLTTARRVLEEKRRALLHDQLNLNKKIPPTLNQVWEAWWKAHQTAFSQSYLVSAECRYRLWIKPELGVTRVDRIQTDAVAGVRVRQLEAGRSPRYANNTLELIRTLVRYAIKGGHLERLPFVVKFLRIQKKPRVTVPALSVSAFFAAIDQEARTPHVRVILRVMIGLGMREGEVLGMRWNWMNPENRTYTVGKAKGKEARVLPVPDWLWSVLNAMPKPTMSEWVFPAKDGKPHRSQYCKKVLNRVCKKMGLGNVTQHRLRATFATLHAEAGTPLPAIQGLMGHKNVTTTMLYIEQTLEARRNAQDTLSQRLGLSAPPSAAVTAV